MGLFDFIRKRLGRPTVEDDSWQAKPVVSPTPWPEPLSQRSLFINEPANIEVPSPTINTAQTPKPPKPRKLTKKQIRCLNETDPGWDKPDEREKIRELVRANPKLIASYENHVEPYHYGGRLYGDSKARSRAYGYWHRTEKNFVNKILKVKLGEDLLGFPDYLVESILIHEIWHIREEVRKAEARVREQQIKEGLNYDDAMTPLQYEALCANLLKYCGWESELTQTTGDQGVDVIARKAGIKVVFQVKKYTSPVGNAAVQEVIAGKVFYKGDFACVVSNATFTESAKALAKAAGVFLIHHEALPTFSPLTERSANVTHI